MFLRGVPRVHTLGVSPERDTGTLLNRWFDGLEAADNLEAFHCLLTGCYSRKLLTSLRAALPPGEATRHGLDDPHAAAPGDPLSASIQTLLRDHLLTDGACLLDPPPLVPPARRTVG